MAEPYEPMRIRLEPERRDAILAELRRFWLETFDDALSDYRADRLLAFFVKELGAPVYNQAVRDVVGDLTERLADLEGEFYEPEPEA